MIIKKHTIIEEYATKGVWLFVTFYYPTTNVTVYAYDDNGTEIFSGGYNSRAGAMIGIGRRFGRVQFLRMSNKEG